MGCGASSSGKGKYVDDAAHVSTPVQELQADAKQRQEVTSHRTTPNDERGTVNGAISPPASPAKTEAAGQGQPSPAATAGGATAAGDDAQSPTLRVEEVGSPKGPAATCQWWGSHAAWIQQRAREILAAYNFFFEHIGLRKGWRTAPFQKEEVQAPFQAAAEVVTVVRGRLDEQAGRGLVLRQLEGSAMNFLWGWNPGRPPGSSHEALEDFFRGLVFATLSDGKGLVEGLEKDFVEYYVSRHPIIAGSQTQAAPGVPDAAPGAEAASTLPTSPTAAAAGDDACAAATAAEVCAVGADDVQGPCLATD